MAAFDDALALVLAEEGGRVNNARDPGGRTNKGVTQAVYTSWRVTKGLPSRSVYMIGPDEVAAIYRHQYADHVRFDDLPPGIGYAVFDEAVNSGPVEAARRLQTALGCTPDGAVGLLTLAAVRKRTDHAALINHLCDGRLTFMRRLKAWMTFGKGWTNRVEFVRAHALEMAAAPVVTAIEASSSDNAGTH